MDEDAFGRIREHIIAAVGLLIRPQDEPALRKAIVERLRVHGLSDPEGYLDRLQSPQGLRRERQALAALLTTGETYFFRDAGQHALLAETILPELLARGRAGRSLRIWSTACATGEEAYSLAILLDEMLGSDIGDWDIRILGTDINPRAIDRAQQGVYTAWSLRGLSAERRDRYFEPYGDRWTLHSRIRERVRFRTADLVQDSIPDSGTDLHDLDLILCRNVLIYMPSDIVLRVASKLAEALSDGGYLVTGHGELQPHRIAGLEARVHPGSVIYQKCPGTIPARPATLAVHPVARVPQERPPSFGAPAVAPAERRSSDRPLNSGPTPVVDPVDALLVRAWTSADRGRYDEAQRLCEDALAREPLRAEPHYLLSVLAQERGHSGRARHLLQRVIYLDPNFVPAHLDLAGIYDAAGDTGRARRLRLTALGLLRTRPDSEPVPFHKGASAGDLGRHLQRLLADGAADEGSA